LKIKIDGLLAEFIIEYIFKRHERVEVESIIETTGIETWGNLEACKRSW